MRKASSPPKSDLIAVYLPLGCTLRGWVAAQRVLLRVAAEILGLCYPSVDNLRGTRHRSTPSAS